MPQLEAAVLDELRARRTDLGFAAPDEINFCNVDAFVLKRRRREVTLHDLSSEGIYTALDELDAWEDPLASCGSGPSPTMSRSARLSPCSSTSWPTSGSAPAMTPTATS